MKLFQIAFLLFNIVAISAKNPPKNVQVVWSGSDQDIAMSGSTNFAAMQEINRSYTSYEQRSDFMADSENIPVGLMTAELLAANSEKMRKKADELIDAAKPKESKYIESRKATYTVTFIELKEDEVLQLLKIGDTSGSPDFPLPKRVMAEVKIQENMEKVLARIQIRGVAKFIGEDCVKPLMDHYDGQNEKVVEGAVTAVSDWNKAVKDWELSIDEFVSIFKSCKGDTFAHVDPMQLAKHLDTNGDRRDADGNITVDELVALTSISSETRKKISIKQGESPRAAPPAEEGPGAGQQEEQQR